MVHHIVMWKFKPEIEEERKADLKKDMEANLSSLIGKVPGLLSVSFVSEPFASSTHDIALVTTQLIFPSSMSSIILWKLGRSKFVPLHPSSMYSSTTVSPCSAAYCLSIMRWVWILPLSPCNSSSRLNLKYSAVL